MKIHSIKFDGVSFMHPGQNPVLKNADFEFAMGQMIWLKAEEGEGKSTLLQVLAGLQTPQSGKYLLNDQHTGEMSFEEFLPYRLQIGYSFDYGGLINNRSLFDNLMLPLLYHKISTPAEASLRVQELMQLLEIDKYAKERPAHVPGRVRKIACLLRPLVMRPQILLLDDPSVGIGQEASTVYADCIHKLRGQGFLSNVFFSSYDEKFMNLFDHQVVHLSEGLLYAQPADGEKKVVSL